MDRTSMNHLLLQGKQKEYEKHYKSNECFFKNSDHVSLVLNTQSRQYYSFDYLETVYYQEIQRIEFIVT